jgi:ubiquinone/menaquinone biosynthesis C-methylase UbiE
MDNQTQHCLEAIYNFLQYDNDEKSLQLLHRMALVNTWAPGIGNRVLEIGCGQGETTVVLAAAVGTLGRIWAVDIAPAAYGRPVSLGEAHTCIKSLSPGERIEFLLSTDLLDPHMDFPENFFDLAVFAHSSWYMSSPQELGRLFARVRPWARRLGYAEWDAKPRCFQQLPHVLALLLQAHMHRVAPQISTANVRSLILPEDARELAESAGWALIEERIVDTSTPLGYGKFWEIQKALEMAEHLTGSDDVGLSKDVRELLLAWQHLLRQISCESSNLSLSTYMFLAE